MKKKHNFCISALHCSFWTKFYFIYKRCLSFILCVAVSKSLPFPSLPFILGSSRQIVLPMEKKRTNEEQFSINSKCWSSASISLFRRIKNLIFVKWRYFRVIWMQNAKLFHRVYSVFFFYSRMLFILVRFCVKETWFLRWMADI